MARIEINQQYSPTSPASTESLEVLAWGPGGLPSQMFCIGSGFNCNANGTIWIEVRYSVQDIPIFYTRNMLQLSGHTDAPKLEVSLQKFENGKWDSYNFGDILPQTHLSLKRDRRTYSDHNNETQTHDSYSLNLDLDIGAVFGG